jgi:hypothetical protein
VEIVVDRDKDVQAIDLDSVMKKWVATFIGDEHFFHIAR